MAKKPADTRCHINLYHTSFLKALSYDRKNSEHIRREHTNNERICELLNGFSNDDFYRTGKLQVMLDADPDNCLIAQYFDEDKASAHSTNALLNAGITSVEVKKATRMGGLGEDEIKDRDCLVITTHDDADIRTALSAIKNTFKETGLASYKSGKSSSSDTAISRPAHK